MPTFTQILNLSVSASFLVLAVALTRLVLKKAPKAFHCALWALVAFRLLCPVSFESELSLVPSREVIPETYLAMEPLDPEFRGPAKLDIVTNPVYETPVTFNTDTTVDRLQTWDLSATVIWLAGMGAMALYALYSYLSLRLRVRLGGWVKGRVWECDELSSPFILGLLRPRIYLPSGLDEITKAHVLAHEHAHLKRLDHIWKPLGFALLTVHWFNPVMWLGYILLCRDIELACDEKVIRQLDKPAIRSYSEALVRCSVSHRMIAVCPLAFGEVGVKGRIKSMLSYKKPGFWALLLAAAAAIAVAVCFLTDPADPVQQPVSLEHIWEQDGVRVTSSVEEPLELTLEANALPEDVLNGKEHLFEPGTIILRHFESTTFYVSSARMSGDELLMEVRLENRVQEAGSILLPFDPLDDSVGHFVHMENTAVTDALTTYPDAATIRGMGKEGFDLCVKMDVYKQTAGDLHFQVGGIYHVTYANEDAPIAQLLEREYRVEEVVYAHPTDGFTYTPKQCPARAVRADLKGELYMSTVTNSALVQAYGNDGVLEELRLTKENFDERFTSEGWTGEDIRADLRQGNKAAWRVYPKYTNYTKESILLLQQDGSVWLAYNGEPDGHFANLYRLTTEPSAPPSVSTIRNYTAITIDAFTGPSFSLSTDGTFTLTPNMLSSYHGHGAYTLTEEELILKTTDGLCTWVFQVAGDRYLFDAERSTPLHYYSDPRTLADLPHMTQFSSSDQRERGSDALNEAIRSAIVEAYTTRYDTNRLRTECHEILDWEVASATPMAGSTEHREIVTVHVAALFQLYEIRGTAIIGSVSNYVNAAITFEHTEGSYVLTDLNVPDSYTELSEIYTDRALELWQSGEPAIREYLEEQCLWEAQRWVDEHPPTAEEVASLVDTIYNSPTPYSHSAAFMDAHPEEFARLIQCDRTTVRYCFEQFAAGNQLDARGHIMMLACQSIIGQTEDFDVDAAYLTGQAWFNLFAEKADALREEIGSDELSEFYPYRAMALECLGI